MKTNHKLALAMVAGVLIGAAGVWAIHAPAVHAQAPAAPPAYVIAEVDVTDPVAMKEYGEKVPATLAPFHPHFLVRGGKTQALEGDGPKTIVVIAFDSAAQARAWYDSPAYASIRPIRQNASKSRIFIAEGVAPQ